MLELFKNFIIYGLGGILSKLIVFLMIPIYTGLMTPEEYGYFDLLFTVTTVAAVFGMLQLDTGFQRFYYENDSLYYKTLIISSVFFSIILLSFVVIIILCINIIPISHVWFHDYYRLELFFAIIAVLVTNLYSYLLCVLRFDDKPKQYALITIFSAFLNATISILFVVVFKMNVLGAILGDLFAHTLVVCLIIYIERDKIRLCIDKNLLKEVFRFSLPQFPARLGGVANTYINRFIMVSMFSVEMIGLYSLGLKIASAVFLVQTAFVLAWKPYLYKILKQNNHKLIIRKISYVAVTVMCSISILLSLYSTDIVKIISNPAYMEASKLVGILSLYNGLFLIKETCDIGVQVTKKTQYTSYLYFISLGVNVVLLLVFPRYFGIVGVALSLLISNIVLVLLTMWVSQKLYPMKFDNLYISGAMIITSMILYVLNNISFALSFKIMLTLLLLGIITFQLRQYFKKFLKMFLFR